MPVDLWPLRKARAVKSTCPDPAKSFSDGNDAPAVVLDGSQRVLLTAPRMTLDAGWSVHQPATSQGGEGPYFNPEKRCPV